MYERALAIHRQWELAVPPPNEPAGMPPTLPFPIGPEAGVQSVVFPSRDGHRNLLAAEQILALQLGPIENQKAHGVITPTRLVDLFESALRSRSVDSTKKTEASTGSEPSCPSRIGSLP